MPTIFKVILGVLVVGLLAIGIGVGVLADGFELGDEAQDETAITRSQYRSVKRGTSRRRVERRLGQPGDPQEFKEEGLPEKAVRGSCTYYNERGRPLGEGRFFRFCFRKRRLVAKDAY